MIGKSVRDGGKGRPVETRRKRLADQLRRNLKRRKAAATGEGDAAREPGRIGGKPKGPGR
jgi:hypothetical protein